MNTTCEYPQDELNPDFLFSLTDSSLLAMIANGLIDANKLARVALANRGLDNNGKWIGFNKAETMLSKEII